jgi:hypothetical protein
MLATSSPPPEAYHLEMTDPTDEIEGIPFHVRPEPRPGGGVTLRIRFLVNGEWSGMDSTEVPGELTGRVQQVAVETAWARFKWMSDFTPWQLPANSLRFNVWVDGVRHDSRVTRECLDDNHLVDWNNAREAFAASPQAQRLRDLAAAKIRAGQEPLIQRDDWL